MDYRIVMMLVLLTLLLLGIGLLIYVYFKSLQSMTKQYQETGKYPKRYLTLVGRLYGIPVSILLILMLFRYTNVKNDLIMIFFLGLAAFIPGQIIGFILEAVSKKKQATEDEVSVKKKSFMPLLIGLFLLITFILMMTDLLN